MKFYRLLKYILTGTLVFALSVVVLAFLLGIFYEKEVKQLLIVQLNKNLKSEIQVKDFDFSLLHHFPYASFEMNEVVMKEATKRKEKDTLLAARNVSLLFNVAGLLKNDISIRKIVLADGFARVRVDKDGQNNYEFWSGGDSTGASSGLDLSKVVLNNIGIIYENIPSAQSYDMTVHKAEASGRFMEESFSVRAKGKFLIRRFVAGTTNWVNGKEVVLESGLKVDTRNGFYQLENSSVQIAGVRFETGGDFTVGEEVRLNLKVSAEEAGFQSFLSLLPPAYMDYFSSFKSSGRFVFNSTIKGTSSDVSDPVVNVDFAVRDGKLTPKDGPVSLEQLNFAGSFTSGEGARKSKLSIPSLTARLGGHPLKASLTLDDLPQPYLTLHASGNVDLTELKPFIAKDTLEALSGQLKLDVSFAGKVKDLEQVTAANLYKVSSSGNVELRNVAFTLRNNPIRFGNINGNFSLHDNQVQVQSISGNVSSSQFTLSGSFDNFITFLLIPDQPATITASLTSSMIDLDELLLNNAATTASDTAYKLRVNPRLVSDLNVRVKELKFRRFNAQSITGTIHLEDQVLTGRNLRFEAMQGDVAMDAVINASRKDSVLTTCYARLNSIDIKRLFYEFENFDQTVMTDQHVRGTLTSVVRFRSSWTTDLTINPAKVEATCDVTIENGELNNFGPILELSKYLKLSDLRNIRFSTLKNVISISNCKIHIPAMEIKSSAMNLTCSGVHDFDNQVDYKLQLLLSDVLGQKVRHNNSEFGEIEDDGLGRTQIFLSMKGPVDAPKFSYDRKSAGAKIKTDVAREKQQLKSILKDEFGVFRKDTAKLREPQKKKKEELQIDWGSENDN